VASTNWLPATLAPVPFAPDVTAPVVTSAPGGIAPPTV
jgi:hypothetical protein